MRPAGRGHRRFDEGIPGGYSIGHRQTGRPPTVTPPRSARSNPAPSILAARRLLEEENPSVSSGTSHQMVRALVRIQRRCEKHRKSRDKVSPQTQGTIAGGAVHTSGRPHHPRVFETGVALAQPCGISEEFRRGPQEAADPARLAARYGRCSDTPLLRDCKHRHGWQKLLVTLVRNTRSSGSPMVAAGNSCSVRWRRGLSGVGAGDYRPGKDAMPARRPLRPTLALLVTLVLVGCSSVNRNCRVHQVHQELQAANRAPPQVPRPRAWLHPPPPRHRALPKRQAPRRRPPRPVPLRDPRDPWRSRRAERST